MYRKTLFMAVFIAGMTTLGVEMSASRLLGTVFGTSNIVWANIIGLILIYLTAGYFLGGKLADSRPFPETFYSLLVWSAFAAGLMPIASRPVLLMAARAVERLDTGVMVGSFLSILILFSIPITLLGCVSPFAIRLSITDPEKAGRISGRIYAISTLGSILGTFLPVLVLIPSIGTSMTFLVFSLALMLVAFVGLFRVKPSAAFRLVWMPFLLLLLSWLVLRGPIKDTQGLIHESESSYNYIQVVEREGTRYLLLNEGQGIHSVYTPGQPITNGTWDYFLSAPFFNAGRVELSSVKRLGLIGLAGGTIAKQYTSIFGEIPIDGWEIDPEIINVGQKYFDMTESNLNAIAADGRYGLQHSDNKYSVIGIDAYRLPYIPWHLTTKEFFQEVHDHLYTDGVVVINVGRTFEDRRIIEALSGTLQSVFSSVHLVDVPETFNSILYATVQPTTFENLLYNFAYHTEAETDPVLLEILERTVMNLQPVLDSDIVFTDERAPIEQLTDSIAIRFIIEGSIDRLR
jgi:predicted membrane-bound spermidine synthase